MQKNEYLLLEPWIQYYSKFTSMEHLCIVDNGSTDETTIQILHKYQQKGVNVIYSYNQPIDFEYKGEILKRLSNQYFSQSDFVFFIDVDEFLGLHIHGSTYSYNVEDIHNYLYELPSIHDSFKYNQMIFNIPFHKNHYYIEHTTPKSFFRGGCVKQLDCGFHYGIGTNECCEMTKLCYIHYHNKPYVERIQCTKEKMKLRIPSVHNIESIQQLKQNGYKGRGHHLIHTLLETEEEYKQKMEQKKLSNTSFYDPTFQNKLHEYNIHIPF